MKAKLKINSNTILFTFMLMYSVMPVVARFVSTYLTTYFYMLIVVTIFASIVFGQRTKSFNRYISVLMPFLLFQLLSFFNQADGIVLWGYRVLLFLIPILAGYHIIREQVFKIGGYGKGLLLFLGITMTTTIIGLINFPQAARILATIESANDPLAVLYTWNNIGGYDFVYIIVLLYPLLILAYKKKRVNAFLTVVLTVAIFFLVLLSEYTTALLFFLISTTLFFMHRELSLRGLVIYSIVAILLMMTMEQTLSKFLRWLAEQINSENISERLNALSEGAEGIRNSEDDRVRLYEKSLQSFFGNPIFGTMLSGGGRSGGHSQILDTLALYGTVGIALMIWMYRYIYILFIKPYEKKSGFGYVVWIMVQAILLSIVNTGFWFEVLALYAPLLLHLIYLEKEEKYEGIVDSEHASGRG